MIKFKDINMKIFTSENLREFLKNENNFLIIESDVSQPFLLKLIYNELENQEIEYFDLLNKKMLVSILQENIVLLINDRLHLLNRDQLVQLIFQTDVFTYKQLEKIIKGDDSLKLPIKNTTFNYNFKLTNTNNKVFSKKMKVIIIQHPSSRTLLPKKILNFLIDKKIITFLKFKYVSSSAQVLDIEEIN